MVQTRLELLEAARDRFALDGFEMSRIEDIAYALRKTRGAFYAHFMDKEDIFLAIFEDDLAHKNWILPEQTGIQLSATGEIWISPRQLFRTLQGKRQWLLYLELHLYARRTRTRSKRLISLLDRLQEHSPGAEFAAIFAALDANCSSSKGHN